MPISFGGKRGSGAGKKWGRAAQASGTGSCGHGGPPTNCICPQCGHVVPRESGIPCFQQKCPQCGSFMARQFLKIE